MKLKIFSRAFFLFYCCISGLSAQQFNKEFGFKSDNDAYLTNGQDRYYTNGLFLSYRKASDKPLKTGLNKKIYELTIGQRMYTAQSGYIPDIQYVDRPITAYLYAGGSVNWLYNSEQSLTADVQVGVIGPAALGKQAQELVHQITGLYRPKGWEYQLNNEMGLNMSLAYSRMIQRSPSQKMDLLWSGYANLGNTFTGLGLSFTLRAGKVNQLFQTTYNRSNISSRAATISKLSATEFFFFAKPQLDIVVYDASVSGALFRNDKGPVTFNTKPWVLSQEFGFMLSKNRFSAQLSYIFKTAEIKSSARPHQYGSISTYYQFN